MLIPLTKWFTVLTSISSEWFKFIESFQFLESFHLDLYGFLDICSAQLFKINCSTIILNCFTLYESQVLWNIWTILFRSHQTSEHMHQRVVLKAKGPSWWSQSAGEHSSGHAQCTRTRIYRTIQQILPECQSLINKNWSCNNFKPLKKF